MANPILNQLAELARTSSRNSLRRARFALCVGNMDTQRKYVGTGLGNHPTRRAGPKPNHNYKMSWQGAQQRKTRTEIKTGAPQEENKGNSKFFYFKCSPYFPIVIPISLFSNCISLFPYFPSVIPIFQFSSVFQV